MSTKNTKSTDIHIRCNEATKIKWRNTLLEFAKKGYTADQLLTLMMDCLDLHYIDDEKFY